MSKQYPSMQKELAARKAAAGYEEEPRARLGTAEEVGPGTAKWARLGTAKRVRLGTAKRVRLGTAKGAGPGTSEEDGPDQERRKRAIRLWFTVAGVLFVVGLAMAIFLPVDDDTDQSPFDETTGDEEVIEYVNERWSIDPEDHGTKARLYLWLARNDSFPAYEEIGEWTIDVSENIAIIRTECPDDADPEEFFADCKSMNAQLEDSLSESDIDEVPVLTLVRREGGGDLMLVVINGSEYYSWLD